MQRHQAPEQAQHIAKKKLWALSAGLLMLSLAGTAQAADFLPLEPGNNWTYKDTKTGATFKVEVARTQIYVNNHTYSVLKGFTPEPKWVRTNEYGNIVYYEPDTEQDLMFLSFETGGAGWFEAHGRTCPQQGQAQAKRVAHDGPAGKWPSLEILYRTFGCADAGEDLEQFAENIGMVRRVANTIAGPRTYDLIDAKVGNQQIRIGTHGSFSVTSNGDPVDGVWKVTLRVSIDDPNGVKVVFPSSQEYDLRLSDDDGNILYTWSADKLFLQALHEKLFTGVWEKTVDVPVPPGVGEFTRTFVLSAWLTTAPNGPQFAAATRVVVPGIGPAGTTDVSRRGRAR